MNTIYMKLANEKHTALYSLSEDLDVYTLVYHTHAATLSDHRDKPKKISDLDMTYYNRQWKKAGWNFDILTKEEAFLEML